jgi:plastocyanin
MKWITILVLIILIGGGIYYFNNRSAEPVMEEGALMETGELPAGLGVSEEIGGEAVVQFNVTGKNFTFDPTEMRVKVGDRVRINFSVTEGNHDLVIDGLGVATKRLTAGQSDAVEFVVSEAGTFEYYCSVGNHRELGMVGSLIVSESAS